MPSEWVSENLPIDAQRVGMSLLWAKNGYGQSVTLLNEHREALFHWPYNASLGEVRDKAMELLKEGRL